MRISLLNTKILFQENKTVVDEIHNETNEWIDYFECFATISGESSKESFKAGAVVDNSDISFTVRYCNKLKNVKSTKHRILWNGENYDIVGLDHLNLKKKALKFRCKKERNL